jgi:hypothetical protein
MKLLPPVALAALALLAGTCQMPAVKDAGHIAENCAAPAVKTLASHILDDVQSALVSMDVTGGIVGIVAGIVKGVVKQEKARAEDEAWQAAKCAVTEVRAQSSVHLGYGLHDQPTIAREALVLTNADAWLRAH